MIVLKIILLALLIAIVNQTKVSAFSENITNVMVPQKVSMAIQDKWQGYIIYSIKEQNGVYVAKVTRDGEPHQYPIRYVTFTKDFRIIKETGLQNPNPPKVEPKKEEPKPETQKEEKPQEPIKPEKPEKPEKPPVIKPPEEELKPRKPEPTTE